MKAVSSLELNIRRQKITDTVKFLRSRPSSALSYNSNHSQQEKFNLFCELLNSSPDMISDNVICPLLIIIAGLWSSYYKRERNHKNPLGDALNPMYHSERLFLEKCLAELLRRKVDPNIQHQHIHRSTAMHWLVAWDRSYEGVEFLRLIKDQKIIWNPNIPDAYNRTPIMLLVARKYFGRKKQAEIEDNRLIDEILTYSPDLTIQDNWGNTALHYAFIKRDRDFIDKIIPQYDLTHLSTIKNNAGQRPPETLSMNYSDSTSCIKKVYDASKSEHLFNRKRWEEEKEKINSCIVI